jgi:hypothetical protein
VNDGQQWHDTTPGGGARLEVEGRGGTSISNRRRRLGGGAVMTGSGETMGALPRPRAVGRWAWRGWAVKGGGGGDG